MRRFGQPFLNIDSNLSEHSFHLVWTSYSHNSLLSRYGLCLFILYALSTLYHSVGVFYHHDPAFKEAFQKLDHVAIYFMIAGCYTPMCLINLIGSKKHPKLGYFVLCTIWICAILGSCVKLAFGPKQIPPILSNGFYLFMGWFAILVCWFNFH
jgi:hemolysin III